jgi:hypothetical protein
MRVGPEIKRGAGWMREGAFDFLELFGSFWGDAKKNKGRPEVKLPIDIEEFLWLELLFQKALFPGYGIQNRIHHRQNNTKE